MDEDTPLERLAHIIATIMKNDDENRKLAEEYRAIRQQINDAVKGQNNNTQES
jgi:hypothetical protein